MTKTRKAAHEPGPVERRRRRAARRPVELELKLTPRDDATAERYRLADRVGSFVAVSIPSVIQVEDRYLDTADGALARAGFAARLRHAQGRVTVTVKSLRSDASGSAIHEREELDGPALVDLPPTDWPPSDARATIREVCGDQPLEELVTLRQARHRREHRHGGTRVELSLDEVEVVSGGTVVDRFRELEIELIAGDPRRLAALDALLAADPGLAPSGSSKLERALRAVRVAGVAVEPVPAEPTNGAAELQAAEPRADREGPGDPEPETGPDGPRPPEPPPPSPAGGDAAGVTASDHVAEAARKVLRLHLERMLAREAGTRSGSSPDDLRKMRVATRRMRAAWRVFGYGFEPRETKRYRSRLRDVAGRLGAVRDLDVLVEAAEAHQAQLPARSRRGLDPLLAAWRTEQETARSELLRLLDSPGYARFVHEYRTFVVTEGAAELPLPPTQPRRIRDTIPSRIWAAHEHVRAYEDALREADVPTLHELRIAAKWLRYTIEFVREPLGAPAEPLIASIVVLQDHLGAMNDADVAASRIGRFLDERGGELRPREVAAIGRYRDTHLVEIERCRQGIEAPWRGVAGVSFRQALATAIADL